MGTTFAHFSILDSNVEETIKFLELIPKKPNVLEIMKRISPKEKPFPESINDLKKPEKFDDEQWQKLLKDWPKFINTLKSQARIYYIGKNNDWTTVFSEEFGLESIDHYSLNLSKKTNKTFLAVGLFDEDIFTLSIIKNGKIVTSHISGAPEIFEMKAQLGDATEFAKVFNVIEEKDKFGNILKNNNHNLDKKIMELEQLVNMKLWIISDQAEEWGWKEVVI